MQSLSGFAIAYLMTTNRTGPVLIALAMSVAGSGCYKATCIRDPQISRGVAHDEFVIFFVFGLVGDPTIDVHQFCPDGKVAQIQSGSNCGTGVLSVLTLGIYTPRKIYVTCALDSGRAATLELRGDSEGQLVGAVRHSPSGKQIASVTRVNGANSWQVAFERNER